MFNSFEHFNELVFTNIDGAPLFGFPQNSTIPLPDGQQITAAVPGEPDTITYWFRGVDGAFKQITADQAFVQDLWLHFAYGKTLYSPAASGPIDTLQEMQGLAHEYHVTQEAMRAAVLSMPHVLDAIVGAGITEEQVWAYTQAEAPWAVGLVGVADPGVIA